MSDEEDYKNRQLAIELAVGYTKIATVMELLPIPLQLPTGLLDTHDTVTALTRAIDIVEEQPVPEEIRADLQQACLSWLTAQDLFLLEIAETRPYRHAGITLALVHAAEALVDVLIWMRAQKD